MIRKILALALAGALSACAFTPPPGTPSAVATAAANVADAAGVPAAPLDATVADEKALLIAAGAIDVTATSITALVGVGVIQPGSPRALRLADALDTARKAVNAAAAARRAGSAASYSAALDDAKAAVALLQSLVKGD